MYLDSDEARARRLQQLLDALECGNVRGREQLEAADMQLLGEHFGQTELEALLDRLGEGPEH